MRNPELHQLLLFLGGFGVFLTLVVISIRRWIRARNMEGLFDTSQGKGVRRLPRGEYRYRYSVGDRYTPPSFRIEVETPSEGDFSISRESDADRWGKRLGLTVESSTGDAAFDEAFFLDTERPGLTRQVFEQEHNREKVRAILSEGFTLVQHDGRLLRAVKRPVKPSRDLNADLVDRVALHLLELSRSISRGSFSARRSPVDAYPAGWRLKRVLVMALPTLLLVGGLLGLFFGPLEYSPLDPWVLRFETLMLSLPLGSLFLWAAFHLLKGRSSSHREFRVAVWLAAAGFVLGGIGGATFLNGYLDTSPAVSYTGTVVRTSVRHGRHGDDYFAHVESWRVPGETERVEVSSRAYEEITPGLTSMTVTTHLGRFGYLWIERYSLR